MLCFPMKKLFSFLVPFKNEDDTIDTSPTVNDASGPTGNTENVVIGPDMRPARATRLPTKFRDHILFK